MNIDNVDDNTILNVFHKMIDDTKKDFRKRWPTASDDRIEEAAIKEIDEQFRLEMKKADAAGKHDYADALDAFVEFALPVIAERRRAVRR